MQTLPAKIIYLDHSNDFSGGQKSLLALLKVLDRGRFNPYVVIDSKAQKMESELRKLGIAYTKTRFFNTRWVEYLMVWWPILQIVLKIRRSGTQLVHCNTFKTGLIGAVASWFCSAKVIFRARLGIVHLSHGIADWIISANSDLILANSHYVKETFAQRFGNNSKVEVVYNPLESKIELNSEVVKHLRSHFFKNPNSFCFGLIGRIERFKKLEIVVEAAIKLSTDHKNFKVFFIGAEPKSDNGSYAKQLRGMINISQLEEHFVFTGFVGDIWEITSLLDAVIICSVGEALSRGVYEAQALGIPVIASNSGGNRELILHNESGLLFAPGDPYSLYCEMKRIIETPPLHKKLAKGGQAKVKELFTSENTHLKEMNLYKSILTNT